MGTPATTPSLRPVSLDDKYDLSRDQVFVTGTQAVIRMLLMQQARDRAAGLDTAGFVSGYRGRRSAGSTRTWCGRRKVLDAANIVFQPGLNEELAATALWGSQQAEMRGEGPPRRRVRPLVRQGPGRRPLRRRVSPRQHGRAPRAMAACWR